MGEFREANGGVEVESPSTLSNPSVCDIGAERWAKAEKATRNIIEKVLPTAVSEDRRRAVIGYVQRLIGASLPCEVFPYGSVPLKTYLPDGDIDLTAFGGATFEDTLANNMVSILEAEDRNKAAEFVVKDVQLIRAEVKLVKCIVQNIVVDISFNQIGGLCTLCFLEQVDRLVGKDHLFKRSIILIKTWCYYESRILGAHHGLISTYALEALVLYIFHFFHATLDGPLAVLYKFLDYFSKFDWDNYCVSLTGPVHISESVVEMPENDGADLLLSNDFVRYCLDMFSVPCRGSELNSRSFPRKHLNIIDPLKENNNLGRSVSKGNFFRIRSAFNYGARQLGSILMESEEDIAEELYKFFSNILDRHHSGERPDVQDPSNGFCPTYIEPSQKLNRLSGDAADTENALSISPDSSKCISSTQPVVFAPHLFFISNRERTTEKTVTNVKAYGVSQGNQLNLTNEVKVLSDLSGDYDKYLNHLQYGRRCYGYAASIPLLPPHPSPFHVNYSRESPHQQSYRRRSGFSHGTTNGVTPSQAIYAVNPMLIPGMHYALEEVPKPRGTGTYFPNLNYPPQGYRPSLVKGRHQAGWKSPRNNGRDATFMEMQTLERSFHELPQSEYYAADQSGDVQPLSSPHGRGHHNMSGLVSQSEGVVEFGSASIVSISETTGQQQESSPVSPIPRMQRVSVKPSSYHLKDEGDFPPLSF